MQSRNMTTSKSLQFPSSRDDIEIITYKTSDGIFRNSEAINLNLKSSFLEINDYVLSLHPIVNPENFYFLRVVSDTKVVILEFQSLEGVNRMNPETEKIVHELSESEIDFIKGITISSITMFLELFSFYYHGKRDSGIRDIEMLNNELIALLRLSNGAKIKFLEELMSLYLSLNGQTYFDVVANVVMSGAFTFGSMFSTTGLYYAANAKLVGKEMLLGAIKRRFSQNTDSRDKGEVHTAQGLSILHLRQFRLRQRKSVKSRSIADYEPVILIDDDSICVKNNSLPVLTGKRLSEKVKMYKLLTPEGLEKLDHFQSELITIMNESDLSEVVNKLKRGNLSSIIALLQAFDNPLFKVLFVELDDFLNHDHDAMIFDRILSVDMLSLNKHRDTVKRNAIRFLSFLETLPTEQDTTDSIVQRFRNATDPTDLILEYLNDFLEMIG